jgi:hypothetical protein
VSGHTSGPWRASHPDLLSAPAATAEARTKALSEARAALAAVGLEQP